jgi:hypothetical protein
MDAECRGAGDLREDDEQVAVIALAICQADWHTSMRASRCAGSDCETFHCIAAWVILTEMGGGRLRSRSAPG